MALISDPNYVFRDWPVPGIAQTGTPHEPIKSEIRKLLSEYQQSILALEAGAQGLTPPNLLIRWTMTNADPNKLMAEPQITPPEPGLALNALTITKDNTGPMTLNGKTLLSASGKALSAGALNAGMSILFFDHANSWRLISDIASSAIQLAAEKAAASAKISEISAAKSAANAESAAQKATEIAGFDPSLYLKNTAAETRFAPLEKKAHDHANKTALDKIGEAGGNLTFNGTAFDASLIGMVAAFATPKAPKGWLKCNGAAVLRTTYAGLFAAIGTTYGVGDKKTTFNLPDLRGEFVRGFDDGRKIDTGRTFASSQGDAMRDFTGWFTTMGNGDGQLFIGVAGRQWSGTGNATYGTRFQFSPSAVTPTANENRPRNIALLYCIKY